LNYSFSSRCHTASLASFEDFFKDYKDGKGTTNQYPLLVNRGLFEHIFLPKAKEWLDFNYS